MNSKSESGSTRSSKKGLTFGLTAGLIGGTAAGMVLGVPGLSGASTDSAADSPAAIVQQVDDTTPPADEAAPVDVTPPADRPDPGVRLREVLQDLVDDGTITADQADAVTTHLVENAPDRGGRRGPGGRDGHGGPGGAISDAVTEALGIDAETLRTQLADGSSLADIATANGVDPQTVIDALVAEAQARIDAAVADGKIDADVAAERTADLEARITARVNGEGGDFGPRGPRGPRGGPGPGVDAEG
jgi:polyhydroxyalkanoate synthesis regulator phasin